MEDEIIIIEVEPRLFDLTREFGKGAFKACYRKETYNINQPINRRPEYLAVRDQGGIIVEMMFKIDQTKSNFKLGRIVPQGFPRKVSIPLRMKDHQQSLFKIWYTSFKTLLTHESTDEFIEEKASPMLALIEEGKEILCNGYYCIHFNYCKFFNQSPTAVTKSSNLQSDTKIKS